MIDESAVTVGEAGWRNEAYGEVKDGGMRVFFHTAQVKHNFRSIQEKRPVFIEKIFITKLVPGDNKLVIDRPMRETDAEEFPREWARFEQKKAALISGTPLEAWNIISDTQKAEFKALNIFTIDQFANLPDSSGAQIMGFNDLRAKAKAFLAASKDAQFFDGIRAETDAKLAAQEQKITALLSKLETLTKDKKPKKEKTTKRTLTPEHLAAMKAGREKAKLAA
jgi:hypothetical protein